MLTRLSRISGVTYLISIINAISKALPFAPFSISANGSATHRKQKENEKASEFEYLTIMEGSASSTKGL